MTRYQSIYQFKNLKSAVDREVYKSCDESVVRMNLLF